MLTAVVLIVEVLPSALSASNAQQDLIARPCLARMVYAVRLCTS
jgi:hypothetical protein